jgi:hypothetical protein
MAATAVSWLVAPLTNPYVVLPAVTWRTTDALAPSIRT